MDINTYIPDAAQNLNGVSVVGNPVPLNQDSPSISNINPNIEIGELKSQLNDVTGFFTLLAQDDNRVIVVTDIIESNPVWFGYSGTQFFVSTSSNWVRDQIRNIGDLQRDVISRNELKSAGYITDIKALYKCMGRVPAGSILEICQGEISCYPYIDFEYKYSTQPATKNELHQAIQSSCKRAINYADGCPIWIPLSGGLDSRLLLSHFVSIGYDDIVTFTYGSHNDDEIKIAEQVADSLNVEWFKFEFTHTDWRDWFQSDERHEYYTQVDDGTMPPLQDWPVIGELKKSGQLPRDAILVPGHTGDFLSGGHLPKKFYSESNPSTKRIVDYILEHHYDKHPLPPKVEAEVRNRVKSVANVADISEKEDAMEAIERWEWRSRQARGIVEQLRIYNYWDVDWWLPLWDSEVVSTFLRLPIQKRNNKKLYRDYVESMYQKVSSEDSRVYRTDKNPDSIVGLGKEVIKNSPIKNQVRELRAQLYKISNRSLRKKYQSNPRYGVMSEKDFVDYFEDSTHLWSYRARERLGEIEFRSRPKENNK